LWKYFEAVKRGCRKHILNQPLVPARTYKQKSKWTGDTSINGVGIASKKEFTELFERFKMLKEDIDLLDWRCDHRFHSQAEVQRST